MTWLPISTRPTEVRMTYLVCDAKRGLVSPWINGVIHNNTGTWFDWQYGEAITHWMPLPPPPTPTPQGQSPAEQER